MPDPALSGSEFKKQLRAGSPKMGLFLNAHSPTVAEQLAHSGYDWLLVDTQHGPMGYEKLSAMLSGIANGGANSLVRVGGYADRPGIQQALDMGADGVLIPYINTAAEAREAISCAKYPTVGTRSVYFPQRSMDKAGLLGYAGTWNTEGIVALQVETASCIENIAEIAAVPGVDILFLGQNDLCMSMGLYNKYEFPHMYTSPELDAATKKTDRAREKEQRYPRPVPLRHRPRRRIPRKGIHFHQHRQRPAPRSDPSRSLCERYGKNRRRKRQVLEAPPHRTVLENISRLPHPSRSLCKRVEILTSLYPVFLSALCV